MKRTIFAGALTLAAGFSSLFAQATPPPKGPAPKSEAEGKAITAIAQAADPDATIKAAEALMSTYADTSFKEYALTMEAHAYFAKRDMVNTQIFGERVLAMNPHNFDMELVVGEAIESGVKEHDLTLKDEVEKVTKLLTGSIEDVKAAPKPNPKATDEQWASVQKFQVAEAHDHLGTLALIQKHWDEAIKEYQIALEGDPAQDAYATRLAQAYLNAGKTAECIAVCDKLLAKADLHPMIKQAVTTIKENANRMKK